MSSRKFSYAGFRSTGVAQPTIFYYPPEKKWAIRCDYLKGDSMKNFLFFLKNACSGVYHPASKTWLVPEERLEKAEFFVNKYYGSFQKMPKIDIEIPTSPLVVDSERQYLLFCNLVGHTPNGHRLTKGEAKKLYYRAAMKYHTDREGGNNEKMTDLNVLYQEVSQALEE